MTDRPAEEILDSVRRRATVISVGGPFNARTIIELPTEVAEQVFDGPLHHSRTSVVDAVEADLDAIRKRDRAVADSALAATALQLAYELEVPFNSATSKSQCARALIEAMERLNDQAPPKPQEKSRLDELRAKRESRTPGGATATG